MKTAWALCEKVGCLTRSKFPSILRSLVTCAAGNWLSKLELSHFVFYHRVENWLRQFGDTGNAFLSWLVDYTALEICSLRGPLDIRTWNLVSCLHESWQHQKFEGGGYLPPETWALLEVRLAVTRLRLSWKTLCEWSHIATVVEKTRREV